MQYTIKLLVTVAVIVAATAIGKKYPSLAGLIATMPLTGLLVLLWLYADSPGDKVLMVGYTRGAIFGIVPSIMFYLTALVCFTRGMSLAWTLSASFAVWLAGAFVHQLLVR
jgi:uncharacterized membrane protein (GlpM family)